MKIPEYMVDGKNICEETVKEQGDEGKQMTKEKVPAFVITQSEQSCHRLSAPFNLLTNRYYPYGFIALSI